MDVREKLVELLNEVQETGVNEIPTGFCCITEHITNEEVASYLVGHGVTVQEWISVDDRLPEEDGDYLVTKKYFGGRQIIDVCAFAKDGETVSKYDLAEGKNIWYFYDNEYGYISTITVTHWMPLPALPKGE